MLREYLIPSPDEEKGMGENQSKDPHPSLATIARRWGESNQASTCIIREFTSDRLTRTLLFLPPATDKWLGTTCASGGHLARTRLNASFVYRLRLTPPRGWNTQVASPVDTGTVLEGSGWLLIFLAGSILAATGKASAVFPRGGNSSHTFPFPNCAGY